jgi:hypothetical protein
MSNTTGSMTAALELKVKDTKKANQLIANLVANQKQTQNAILQFPDAASVEAFATDPEYVPHGKARQEGAINSFQLIDDTDAAGTIPYLSAG